MKAYIPGYDAIPILPSAVYAVLFAWIASRNVGGPASFLFFFGAIAFGTHVMYVLCKNHLEKREFLSFLIDQTLMGDSEFHGYNFNKNDKAGITIFLNTPVTSKSKIIAIFPDWPLNHITTVDPVDFTATEILEGAHWYWRWRWVPRRWRKRHA